MYQVGDRVMIRPDIKEGNHIDQEQYVTSEMASFAGAITKIVGGGCIEEVKWFELEIDCGDYWWGTKMLIPLKQRTE